MLKCLFSSFVKKIALLSIQKNLNFILLQRARNRSSWWRDIVRIRDEVDGLEGGWFGDVF
jgi:hypothetical protein